MKTLADLDIKWPTEPFKPSAFDNGVAEQLRDIAAMIETGTLRLKHFALTVDDEGGQTLELNAESNDDAY